MTPSPKRGLLVCAAATAAAVILSFDIILVGEIRSLSDAQRRGSEESQGVLERAEESLDEKTAAFREDAARMSDRAQELSRVLVKHREEVRSLEKSLEARFETETNGASMSATSDLTTTRLIQKGREAFEERKYEKAADLFANALRVQPENREARRYEAACGFYANPSDSEKRDRAEEIFLSNIDGLSTDTLALRTLGFLSMEKGEWETAVAYFERLEEIGGTDRAALSAAAAAAAWAGNPEKAALLSKKAAGKSRP